MVRNPGVDRPDVGVNGSGIELDVEAEEKLPDEEEQERPGLSRGNPSE